VLDAGQHCVIVSAFYDKGKEHAWVEMVTPAGVVWVKPTLAVFYSWVDAALLPEEKQKSVPLQQDDRADTPFLVRVMVDKKVYFFQRIRDFGDFTFLSYLYIPEVFSVLSDDRVGYHDLFANVHSPNYGEGRVRWSEINECCERM